MTSLSHPRNVYELIDRIVIKFLNQQFKTKRQNEALLEKVERYEFALRPIGTTISFSPRVSHRCWECDDMCMLAYTDLLRRHFCKQCMMTSENFRYKLEPDPKIRNVDDYIFIPKK